MGLEEYANVIPGYSAYNFVREPTLDNLLLATIPPAVGGYAIHHTVLWLEAENVRRYGVGARYGLRQMMALKVNNWHQAGRFALGAAPYVVVGAGVYVTAQEVNRVITGNLGMSEVGHTGSGAYTHPFEGGSNDEIYYPGKSFVDWVADLW